MIEIKHFTKRFSYSKYSLPYIFVLCAIVMSYGIRAQEQAAQDTAKVQLKYNKKVNDFGTDTGYVQTEALDIGSDRGLFILSADKKMQMRILGSVRGAFNYGDQDMQNTSSFNPFEIPTNISTISPNYFASLSQSRLGFEVTRHTANNSDVFIRIETDFASTTTTLRIRHAYGQFGHLLVGQTWSLFSNVNYRPATVSFNGVAGAISTRTPQIRYFSSINKIFNWAVGIEYSIPDFVIPDSINVSLLQVIPDLTAKIDVKTDIFTGSIGGIITTISGRDTSEKIAYRFGFGVSLSGIFSIKEKNKIYFSFTSGRGISHFIAVLAGKRQDAVYNPIENKFVFAPSLSGFVAYERNIVKNLTANISAGFAAIRNGDFQNAGDYSHGYNILLNAFWTPVEGARLGVEYANGQRVNKGGARGMANKISVLMYYDF